MAFSVPLAPGQREWNEYTASHVGRWRGMWTTYDAAGVQQGEADRIDTTIQLSSDGTTVKHVNTLYVESVDSECSKCFDSVETRDMPVGEYTKDNFRQRASGATYLSGPGVTRRGDMTTEIGFRDADRRVRCIVSHRPQFNGPAPPSQLALERIVIVRETKLTGGSSAPSAELLWPQFDHPGWLGLWCGRSMILENDVGGENLSMAWREEALPPTHLRKCRCAGAPEGDAAPMEFNGGIYLEVPSVVLAGKPAELLLRWAIGRCKAGKRRQTLQSIVRFEALSRIVDTASEEGGGQNVRISPPKLLRFAVETLEPVESAGLG